MTLRVLRRALFGAALLTAGGASAQDLTLVPPDGQSSSFRSVLGDVNRDGVQDYALSDSGFGSDPSVLVFDGDTGDLLYDLRSPEGGSGTRFGFGLDLGDVDGDCFADVVVGAPGANDRAGAVYVFSGRTGELMMTLTSPNPAGSGIGGFGAAIDVTNVAGFFVSDIVVGSSAETVDGVVGAGRAYVFLGSYFSRYRGLLVATLEPPTPTRFGAFGFKLASADFNRDWRNDPVVATSFGGDDAFSAGRADVFRGGFFALRQNRLLATVIPPDLAYDPDVAFEPPSGILDMATGDFDGDHRPDLALALPEAGPDADNLGAGVVYVYTNPNAEAPALTITSPNAVGSPEDPFEGGGFGSGLSAADLDGDGDAELVIGASSEDGQGGTGSGVVYVVDGRDGSVVRQIDVPPSARPASFRSFGFDVDARRDRRGSRVLVADVGSNEGYVYINPLAEDAARADYARIVAQAEADGVDPSTRLAVPVFTPEQAAGPGAEAQDAEAVGLQMAGLTDAEPALTVAPNPSAGRAQVSFTLSEATDARVAVYDALGRQVAVLAQGTLAAQSHTFQVQGLAAGAYVVRMDGAGVSLTSRLTVVR